MLWSINERLAGRPGLDLSAPDMGWLDDLCELASVEAEEAAGLRDDEDDDEWLMP